MNHISTFILESFEDFIFHQRSYEQSTISSDHTITSVDIEPGTYLDHSIAQEIKRDMRYVHERRVSIGNLDLHIKCYSQEINTKFANFLCRYSCFLAHLLNKIKEPSTRKQILLKLICYKGKRTSPQQDNVVDNTIFESKHINGGVTILFSDVFHEIIVYRLEEIIKVMTHEFIHSYNLDAKSMVSDEALNKYFCMDTSINVNETYTDALACLLNTIMYSLLENKYNNLNEFNIKVQENFKKELSFITGQAVKVLKIVKYNKKCTFINKEKTHAIAYYVIKAILMSNTENYIKYLIKNNYQLKDTTEFKKLIWESINNYSLRNYSKTHYKSLKYLNSMRMTSLDILELIQDIKSI